VSEGEGAGGRWRGRGSYLRIFNDMRKTYILAIVHDSVGIVSFRTAHRRQPPSAAGIHFT